MDPQSAKSKVLAHEASTPINKRWMAARLGVAHQSLSQWFTGTEPRDPLVWVRMAQVLGLTATDPDVLYKAREFALEVIDRVDDPEIKRMATNLIREISAKTYG